MNLSVEPLDFLLGLGIDLNVPNILGPTPLHVAATYGADAHIELLLKAGGKINEINAGSFYPIHYRVANPWITNRSGILDGLTSPPEITVNSWKSYGVTPLHIAARHGTILTIIWSTS